MLINQNVCFIEARAAAGGDEAKIWAKDLIRMYLKYAEKNGWKTQFLSPDILKIKGADAYKKLQFETGVHRVQRIPTTEKRGRIHTSTATIAVLPEITDSEVKINQSDLEWQFYRASGQGGQNVQKVSTAVRLTHKPTGIIVSSEQERTQVQNREITLQLLRQKLWEREQEKRQSTITEQRAGIGRGMRSEKIRTYNYPQSRITDHRLGKSFHNLESILGGNLGVIVDRSS